MEGVSKSIQQANKTIADNQYNLYTCQNIIDNNSKTHARSNDSNNTNDTFLNCFSTCMSGFSYAIATKATNTIRNFLIIIIIKMIISSFVCPPGEASPQQKEPC